jgi:uncharacterized protein YegP (UPF0339 family)/uncharacterized membrane protein YeaQ/YmgE (transglycosylase-associated protein family)
LRGSKFEIFKDKTGEFRFHLRASNGEIVLASEGYTQKHNALKGIESVRERAPDAEIVDLTLEESAAEEGVEAAVEGALPVVEAEKDLVAVEETPAPLAKVEEAAPAKEKVEAVEAVEAVEDILEPKEEVEEPPVEDVEKAEEPSATMVGEEEGVEEAPAETEGKGTLRSVIAVIAGLVGAVIGYYLAVSVSDFVGIMLSVVVGFVIGFGSGWKTWASDSKKSFLSLVFGAVGGFIGYVVSTSASNTVALALAVVVGGLIGFAIVWES